MDDAAAGFPESDSVLGAGGGQEVINLAVDVLGAGQVLVTLDLCLDQVVTVNVGGDSDLYNKEFQITENKLVLKLLILTLANHIIT